MQLAFRVLITGFLRCMFIFIPFVAFQAYGYYNLCAGRDPETSRPWCKAKIPLLYNFIQSHYWGVGFLRYFQFKQLPNFLLASPILSMAVCSIIYYVKLQPTVFFSLGFQVDPKTASCLETQTSTVSRGMNLNHELCKLPLLSIYKISSKMPVSSLWFGQFFDFRPTVCFSASGSKRFDILPFSSGSLTPSIFLC
ncbi:putative GPI mannosyltransferase 2 [Helianthus anomalus]